MEQQPKKEKISGNIWALWLTLTKDRGRHLSRNVYKFQPNFKLGLTSANGEYEKHIWATRMKDHSAVRIIKKCEIV